MLIFQNIKNLFTIIRWPNLLMIGAIQVLIYLKLLDLNATRLGLSDFIFLSFITILIAAAGYVINDYYDQEIDRINKPDKKIVGQLWSLNKVRLLYMILTAMGAILSLVLAWHLSLWAYISIYPLASLGLWCYSYTLKCRPVIGNIWVALFCAGVVAIIVLPDILLKNGQCIKEELWFYMAFAFLSTWYREVVKDIEDMEGDRSANCRTAVVRYGIKPGKIMALVLSLLLVASLLGWDAGQTDKWIKLGLNILQGFTVASIAFVWWAKNNTYYHHASNVIKLVMLGGTGLLLLM